MKNAMLIVVAVMFLTGVAAAGATTAGDDVPKVLELGSLSKVYEPVRLDHAEHISMAGGCGECHHQHRGMQISSCSTCHKIDASFFRKNAEQGALKACSECHPASTRPGDEERLTLKAAYHQACFKCHAEQVGGKPLSCTELCHTPKRK